MPNGTIKSKVQATHDFFPRNKVAQKKTGGMIFNKAPINRNDAYIETKQKVISEQEDLHEERRHGRKQASFMSKLYQDDDEFDELKVHGLINEDDEDVNQARNST
jgi:hypothetical protein